MRQILPFVTVLSVAAFLSGCDPSDFGPSDRFTSDFHYTLKPSDRIGVTNFNGAVEVTSWDEASIDISGAKYASTKENLERIRIDVRESPELTEVRTSRPDIGHGNFGARFLIRVPRRTAVGRIASSNGSVRLQNIAGGAEVETSNGPIDLESVSGKLRLTSSNGRIRVSDATGACEAETSNGSVTMHFREAPDGPVRVNTSNGGVELSIAKSPKDSVKLKTSNGSITLGLPADAAARLNAQTTHGSVTSEFDVATVQRSDDKKRELEGTVGAGGPLIELTTNNGAIRIRKAGSGN
jgi:hypothetical protein